jgi:hypothetical protein
MYETSAAIYLFSSEILESPVVNASGLISPDLLSG